MWGFYKVTGSSRQPSARCCSPRAYRASTCSNSEVSGGPGVLPGRARGPCRRAYRTSRPSRSSRGGDGRLGGLVDQIDFRVMDAERLDFPDRTFDLVPVAVLHHLDLSLAYPGVARVLRPGGSAIFVEPLGHNPLINAYRRRTPSLRTVDEHPLLLADLEQAREQFRAVDARYFHLSSLAAIPIRRRQRFRSIVAGCERLDRGLFRMAPGLHRRHTSMVVIRMSRWLRTTKRHRSLAPCRRSSQANESDGGARPRRHRACRTGGGGAASAAVRWGELSDPGHRRLASLARRFPGMATALAFARRTPTSAELPSSVRTARSSAALQHQPERGWRDGGGRSRGAEQLSASRVASARSSRSPPTSAGRSPGHVSEAEDPGPRIFKLGDDRWVIAEVWIPPGTPTMPGTARRIYRDHCLDLRSA